MREQRDMLAQWPWDVLIILDACRADYFLPLCDLEAYVVRSPAPCTRRWIHAMLDHYLLEGATYVNANPVVQQVMSQREPHVDVHYIRRDGNGTVEPETVTEFVLARIEADGQPRRLVVHYLQPHAPNIGHWPDARSHWSDGTCQDRQYAANLWRAWVAVQDLIEGVRGNVVITADHGEMLRPHDGRAGHRCEWEGEDVLHQVPWLQIERASGWAADGPVKDELIEQRMRDLGYA